MKILLCGGLAGVTTWASIFPLDMIKTRFQTQIVLSEAPERQPLLRQVQMGNLDRNQTQSAVQIARQAYRTEGINVFFRGLGVCSIRAFLVNAVQVSPFSRAARNVMAESDQWAVYEWLMRSLKPS